MARIIEKVDKHIIKKPAAKRVAAYARVSTAKDAMHHSLSAQISFYSAKIQNTPGWIYCGVYADEAITGTKEDRENFQKLLFECRAGNIDMIITKSISRFARNTVTLLSTVRELKELGIDVFFEEQNIHTISPEGEFMLTILASFAQEESRSASENQKWRIQKNFQEGKPWSHFILGYKYENDKFVIVEKEAKTVRKIFTYCLAGMGRLAIAERLNLEGDETKRGGKWRPSTVSGILKDYTYTGNLLLQKTYRENYLTKVKKKNTGQLPQYHIKEAHEAIIPIEVYNAVQFELAKRADKYSDKEGKAHIYPFTGLIFCAHCGKSCNRKTSKTRVTWVCSTYNTKGKKYCPLSKQIPENNLIEICKTALNVTSINKDTLSPIKKILIDGYNTATICFRNGTKREFNWYDRSRSESWTEEMRASARKKTYERIKKNASN